VKESREYPTRPFVGAGAIVRKGKKVLLVKRKYPPNDGLWSLPGGLVELGETAQEAAMREVKEETGLSVGVDRLFDVGSEIQLDPDSRTRYHFILVDYLATPTGGIFRLNAESSGHGWFSSDEIKKLDMSRGTRKVLELYFRSTSRALGSARRPQGKRSS
jgi:8-oxo-dGTP diphosphatase